ncbi:ATP-binding protein [Aquincola sp. MAHUQ-54]|uniref:histidine kinase n=1 Tax=Aquincola agrisoli TaxID=3119538 RepID=A0AAW9QK38_9BURK
MDAAVDHSARAAAPSWRQRLDTLRVKLFVAIAGANVVLVMAAYLIYGWSFDQGLVEYLNRADEARLTPLIVRLAEGHQAQGGWDWVAKDRQRWTDLLREELGMTRGRREGDAPPAAGREGAEPAPPPAQPAASGARPALPPFTIDPRLLLFDADGTVLIGPADRHGEAVRKPIVDRGRTVGYLGYVPRLQMVASLERLFSAQQNRRFLAIAVGLLVAVVVTAALIAHWLSRRLGVLGAGTAALMRGEYTTRLRIDGHDELAQLGVHFNRLAQTLEAAQRARQQWIADIAHELRTPLATLRAEIEALQDGVRPLTLSSLGSLAQEVTRLARLVEDLRVLSLSDMGALSYRSEPLDLGELIEEGFGAGRAAVQAHGLQLRLALPPGLQVLADGDRLAQVFANLLQNTLRYTEAPATLDVRLHAEDGHAHVVWQDSPPGVPEDDLPRLTDRLFRVDASRARASGGSGLGLAIVKAIVEAHGGRLSPGASALGGLRWDLWLPLARTRNPHA